MPKKVVPLTDLAIWPLLIVSIIVGIVIAV